jgi:hypothetical protein
MKPESLPMLFGLMKTDSKGKVLSVRQLAKANRMAYQTFRDHVADFYARELKAGEFLRLFRESRRSKRALKNLHRDSTRAAMPQMTEDVVGRY